MQLKLKKARIFSSRFLHHLNYADFHPFYSIYYVFNAPHRIISQAIHSQIILLALPLLPSDVSDFCSFTEQRSGMATHPLSVFAGFENFFGRWMPFKQDFFAKRSVLLMALSTMKVMRSPHCL
ncbi:hypothetical protein [Allobaculum sp. JKK-2023]|uniref:hypothetical protein n=1 Tax=Allobaculum sp. JKK-2023 TaxID=3108943 RepID=UPI002B0618A3|nr:hypothetical protein [Allobaculum sp. JKK-2023]